MYYSVSLLSLLVAIFISQSLAAGQYGEDPLDDDFEPEAPIFESNFVPGKYIVETSEVAPDSSFSDAILVGNLLFLSGNLGFKDGELLEGIVAQTEQTLLNLQVPLDTFGITFAHCVKTGVYLADVSEFTEFNDAYKPFFPDFERPARTTVAVSGLFGDQLGLDPRIEIDLICYVPFPELYI